VAYYEHPDYVPLLKSSYLLWHELEAQAGPKLIYVIGGLYMGPRDGHLVGGSLLAAKTHGLQHEIIERSDLSRRYPQFHLPENFVGAWEPLAGFILPEKAIAAHAQLAMRHGAELHGREAVVDWAADGQSVRVTTNRGAYSAQKIIFCGGAWTSKLVNDLGIPLRVTRQVLGWVWPKIPRLFELDRLPVWAIDHLDGSIHYGFPMIPDCPGFKIAHHAPAKEVDPDKIVRETDEADERTFRPILKEFIPQADGPLLSMRVCMYTNSPDHHFLLGPHPKHDRVLMACGFSGHGFKFAPVIGKALAELAADGRTSHPIDFLGFSRFG